MRLSGSVICVLGGVWLVGCSKPPSRTEYLQEETECLRIYCTSNAITAESGLIDCIQFLRQCQKAKMGGIIYDEDFMRIYGRLYLVETHLGKKKEAEEYFQEAVKCDERVGSGSQSPAPNTNQLRQFFENDLDQGLKVAWKN